MAIKKDFHIAAHPGEVLQMMLDENGLSQTDLAKHLKEKHSKINEICRGKRGISAEMATKLGLAFNQSADLWMGLQAEWELSQVDAAGLRKIGPIRLRA